MVPADLPHYYYEAFHEALEIYPELEDVDIRVLPQKTSGEHCLECRPVVSSLFSLTRKPEYKITISQNDMCSAIWKDSLSQESRNAIMAHELAHVIQYKEINSSKGLLWLGVKYFFSKKFRINFENEANMIVRERGLGEVLQRAFTQQFNSEHSSQEMKTLISEIYLPSFTKDDLLD